MIPRLMGRPVPAALLALFAAISISGCQDGQIDTNQVCQFQCDYTFDGNGDPEAAARLTVRDVVQVIANAIAEANANGITDFTISVNDHLNNVLAVYDSDADTVNYSRITSQERPGSDFQEDHSTTGPLDTDVNFGLSTMSEALDTALDGIFIPASYAAISKAGTANYFSTQGNAFSTRTANTLIQQNFVPGETDRPGGPLFAVQIAQLVCSDINTRQNVTVVGNDVSNATGSAPLAGPNDLLGPRRLPVGFAADPGGLPLYKDGIPELDEMGDATDRTGKVVVGSVGIEYNGIYSLDRDATNKDRNIEERIAVAATRGFEADKERRANRITVAGRALRFFDDGGTRSRASDVTAILPGDVGNEAAILALLAAENGGVTGDFVNDTLYFPFDEPRQGVFFLDPASGIVAEDFEAADAGAAAVAQGLADARGEKLVDSAGADRYPAIDSVFPATGAGGLTSEETQELLINALLLAENTRAQTRTPLGGQARIDVAVVDLDGNVLGFARSQDALIDGVDVTIAKTRQAAFWSKNNARTQILAAEDPLGNNGLLNTRNFDDYIQDTADFLGEDPADIFEGSFAWSSIALGGIANPDFPPGVLDADEGPLSRNDQEWSIFSTGIQTEIVLPGIALGLCEEVPDLADVLNELNNDLGGLVPPLADPFDISAGGVAARRTFCRNFRTAAIGNPDPAQQETCIQGVQDGLGGGGSLITGLQNGFHIFQGAVPIYRGNTLIGAYGVSGDGAEQDDFVPFVALDIVNKNQTRRGALSPIGNAPKSIRADRISVQDINLRYVVCPPAPFLSSNEQNGCSGR
ncbi:MAG: hypothetical protein AB8G23_09385 [Myxococcota bacterium]